MKCCFMHLFGLQIYDFPMHLIKSLFRGRVWQQIYCKMMLFILLLWIECHVIVVLGNRIDITVTNPS